MSLWKQWVALFEEKEDPAVPHYDPVHLAVVLVACMVVVGALFWLMWTLFVYEGGLPRKLAALIAPDPQRPVSFEGWAANAAALLLCALFIVLLQKADRRAAARAE